MTWDSPPVLATRRGVPWLTVLPLAVVLSYADGFWTISLRGAVGAIERTQAPFATWLRESTLLLPVFVFAVLGALTLARRWFGSVLRRDREVVATAMLIVVAGTLAGVGELAASSAYDYRLQSQQLQSMGSMAGMDCTGDCVAMQQHASLWLQVRAVGYGSGIFLATNLVLVGWTVALLGGRLDVSGTPRHRARAEWSPKQARDRIDDLHLLLVATLLGSAVVHSAVVPEHLAEWNAAGIFLIVLTAAQTLLAATLLWRPSQAALVGAGIVSLGPLTVWAWSRSLGLPFGPTAGVPEPIGLADVAACALEIGALLALVVLLRGARSLRGRPPTSAHVGRLTLVAVIAVTAVGLEGTGFARTDDFGATRTHDTSH